MSDHTPKPGDVNGDGVVNEIDLQILLSNYGGGGHALRSQGDTAGDPTGGGGIGGSSYASAYTPDGVIDDNDLVITLANYAP